MSTVLAEERYRVTPEAIVRYAGASGDFTPVHYDPDTLAAAGYDRFFAMGMLVAGRLGGLVATTFGDDAVRDLRVRFRERSWVGATVTVRMLALDDAPGRRRVRLEAVAGDSVIADGEAVVALSPGPPASG